MAENLLCHRRAREVPVEDPHVVKEASIQRRLRKVMGAVFGIEPATIAPADSPETVAAWDSVGHLQLMLALEDEFQIRFDVDELASLKSVAMIEARLAGDVASE